MNRPSGRAADQLRPIRITRHYTKHAEGSVLVEFGDTKVICTVSAESGVPRFLKGQGQGWLTAEYGMLPRSTGERNQREASRGKQGGRTLEIQRLIGRSLRAALDLSKLGENTLYIDCDVIQADGGTRTASITGATVALIDALAVLKKRGALKGNPLKQMVAAVSVGIYQGVPVLDLDYLEDSAAETDLNVVMTDAGGFIEVQGTAEGAPFRPAELNAMLELAQQGMQELFELQRAALADEQTPGTACRAPEKERYMNDVSEEVAATPGQEARQWAMFCHFAAFIGLVFPFGSLLGPLIVWQLKRESDPFVDAQGKEALNFQITVALAMFVSFLLMLVVIGFFLLGLVCLAALVLTIIAGIKANEGKAYRYPFCLRLIK